MPERHLVSLRSSLIRRPRPARRGSRAFVVLTLLLAPLVPLGVVGASPAEAASNLTITPITWDVIGIDSNKPSDAGAGVGPNVFPVGARICNTGSTTATATTADLYFGGDKVIDNPYLSVQGSTTVAFGDVAPGACVDAYFNVQVQRTPAAYDTTQRYTITATSGTQTVSTPSNRQLYVEHLISQNRNNVQTITGPTTVYVGGTYTYRVTASTATQGYEQLESFLTFPNTIFQLLKATTTYTSPTAATNDLLYADACGWDPNIGPRPPTGTYLSCDNTNIPDKFVGGKAGGDITMEYVVKVTEAGSGTLSSLIYDYSGSSFHYNGDYGTPVNALKVTTVNSDMAITKTHTGTFQRGSNAQYTLTVTNAGSASVDGPFTVTDTLPAGLTFVSASGTGYSGCAANGQVVTCQLAGPIAAGGTRPLLLTVAVGSAAADPSVNTATVSQGVSESNTANNTARDTAVVNSDPVAVRDTATTNQSTAITLDPRSNDTDVDPGDTRTITGPLTRTATPHGSVLCTATSCTYTPVAGYVGSDSFTYTITDGRGGTSSAIVTVLVADQAPAFDSSVPTNTAQTAVAGSGSFTRLVASDPDAGDVLTYTLAAGSGPLPAGVTLTADGQLTGTPTTPGTYPVTIVVSDGKGGTDTDRLTLTVTDPRTARLGDLVFDDANGNGSQDAGETGLAGAVVVLSSGGNEVARATTSATGAYAFTGLAAGSYTVTLAPPAGYVATTPSPLTRTLTVGADVTDADFGALAQKGTVTLTVFSDFDASRTRTTGEPVRPGTTVTATSSAGAITTGVTGTDGTVTFTLDGGSYTFAATTTTGQVVTTGPGTVTVAPGATVDGLLIGIDENRPPVAVDDTASTPRGVAITLDPRSGDTDPDGDQLTIVGNGPASSGTVTCSTTSCTYTPLPGFEGTATFTYTVRDTVASPQTSGTSTATVRITVGGNAPAFSTAGSNTGQTVTVDGRLTPLVANDADRGDNVLTYTLTSGSLPLGVILNSDGTFTGTPTTPGTTSGQITVTDSTGKTAVTTLVVVVNAAPTGPTANADTTSTRTGTPVTVAVLGNDTTPSRVAITAFTQPAAGSGAVTCSAPGTTGTSTSTGAPTCTYTPAAGFGGTATFTYTISDTSGRSSTATVSVLVNSAPVITSPASRVLQLGGTTTPVVATDADRDAVTFALKPGSGSLPPGITLAQSGALDGTATTPGLYTVTVVASDPNGGVTEQLLTLRVNAPPAYDDTVATNTSQTVPATTGTLAPLAAADPDGGTLTFALAPGSTLPAGVSLTPGGTFTGSPTTPGTTTVSIVVTDGQGGSDTTVLRIVVTDPATGRIGDLVYADTNGNGTRDAGEPGLAGGTVVVSRGTTEVARATSAADGSYLVTGLTAGSYTVTLLPPSGYTTTTDPQTVTLTVGQTVLTADLGARPQPGTVSVTVFSDYDRSRTQGAGEDVRPGTVVTATPVGGGTPVSGTTSPSGVVVLTLPAGQYTVQATARTGEVVTTAALSVPVAPGSTTTGLLIGIDANRAPVAGDDVASTPRGVAVTLDPRLLDTDPDGDALQVVPSTQTKAGVGTLECTATACTFTPDPGFEGTAPFDYVVRDVPPTGLTSLTDTGTIVFTVGGNPPAYTSAATNTGQTVDVGTGLTALAATDPDKGSNRLTYTLTPGDALPPGITLNPDGSFGGTVTAPGTTTFSVVVTDSTGKTATTTLTVVANTPTVGGPTANADSVRTRTGTAVDVPVLANDVTPSGPVTLTPLAQTVPGGSVTCSAAPGTAPSATPGCRFTPDAGFAGTATFTYTITDGLGRASTATVSVEVNQPPVAVDDRTTTAQRTAVVIDPRANDTDADAPTSQLVLTSPADGTAVRTANGTVTCSTTSCTYTPDAGFAGTDSFPYTVRDADGGTDSGVVLIVVENVAPAFDDTVRANSSQVVTAGSGTLAPLAARDLGGDPLTFAVTTGTLPDGVTLDPRTGAFTGSPTTPGTTTVTITVTDDEGGSDTTVLTITATDPASGSIGDRVFSDTNGNGTADAGEAGLGGATVVVSRGGNEVARTTSAADGTYAVSGLAAGTYVVTLLAPDGYTTTTSPITVPLSLGAAVTTADLGAQPQPGTLTVTAFSDYDRSTTRGAGEPVHPGTVVVVTNTVTGAVTTATTASPGGATTFTLAPGTYDVTAQAGTGQVVTTSPVRVVLAPGGTSTGTLVGIDENRAPVAVDDTTSTPRGVAVTLDARLLDSDPDGDSLSLVPSTTTATAHGTVTCTADSCTYTPDAGYEGTDTFTYTVQDAVSVPLQSLRDTGLVTVTVGGTPPAFTADSTNTGQTLVVPGTLVPLTATDPDKGTNVLTFDVVSGTLPPGVSLLSDGRFDGTASTPGTYTAQVSVTDSSGKFDTTTLTVVVNAPSAAGPAAAADAVRTPSGTAITVPVLVNDTTPTAVRITATTSPDAAVGTVVCDTTTAGTSTSTPAPSCTFTPAPRFGGTATFTYTITDAQGRSSTATVTVLVNSAPVITSPSARALQLGDTPAQVTTTDADNDVVTVTVTDPSALPPGLTLGSDGRFTGTATTAGTYTVTVVATDPNGGRTTQTLTITVNAPPFFTGAATNDAQTVLVGTPLTDLAATDPDGGTPRYTLTSGTLPAGVTLQPDGRFTGSPTTPGTTTAVITVTDGQGGSETTSLQVTVVAGATIGDTVFSDTDGDGVQDPGEGGYPTPVTVTLRSSAGPVVTTTTAADGSYSFTGLAAGDYTVAVTGLPAGYVATTTSGTITLTAGQVRSDVDLGVQQRSASLPVLLFRDDNGNGVRDAGEPGVSGTAVTLTGAEAPVSQPTGTDGTTLFTGLPAGSVTVSLTAPQGTVFTTPVRGGTTASRTVVLTDGTTATVQEFGVRVSTSPPVAVDDTDTTSRGVAVSTPVLRNDTDADGDQLSVVPSTSTAFVLAADGSRTTTSGGDVVCSATECTYTPAAGFDGKVAYDYTVSDTKRTDPGTVVVTVVNNPPVYTPAPTNTAQQVASGSPLTRVTATDLDNDPVTYAVVPVAGQGLPPGVVLLSNGSFSQAPVNTTDVVQSYTVTIRATSAGPLTADTTLTIRVLPANRPPAFTTAPGNTAQDIQLGGTFAPLEARDPDGDTLGYAVTGGTLPPGITLSDNGNLDGTATAGGTYTVTVTVTDPSRASDTTTLVLRVNTPPVAADDSVPGTVDTPLQVDVLAGDTDADGDTPRVAGPFTATPTAQGGSVTCTTTSCTYTPAAGFVGPDTFTYTVSDGRGGSDTGTVTVTVRAVPGTPGSSNLPPVFDGPSSQTVPVGTTPARLRSTDPEGGTVRATLVSGSLPPGVSALNDDGTFTGSPQTPGTYRFDVLLSDPQGASTRVTVTIVVPDAPPIAQDDGFTVPAGATSPLPVLRNDRDPGDGPVTIVGNTQPATGTVTCASTSCSYSAPASAVGDTVTFDYTVQDSAGQTDTATVTLTVGPVGSTSDLPPAFTNDPANTAQTVPVGTPLAPVKATDDKDPVVYSVDPATLPPGVRGIDPATGAFLGAPTTPGTYAVVVTATAGPGSTTTTIQVVVTNTRPVAGDDAATTPLGTPITFPVLGNDKDVDPGQTLTVVGVTQPSSGSVTCTADGQCTYTPGGTPGDVTFTYTVSDGFSGGTDTATVTVTVTPAPTGTPTSPSPSPSPTAPNPSPSPTTPSPSPSPTTPSPSPTSPSPSPSPTSPSPPANRPPVAADDAARTTAGTAVTVPVLANDGDPDGDPLTLSVTRQPTNGTVVCTTAGCRYVPKAGFAGTDTFTYTVSDGKGGTDTATVTVTVAAGPAANRAPVAGDDTGTTTAGTAVVLPVLGNDTDADGDVLAVTLPSRPAHGTVTCTATACTYTPAAGYVGTDTFTYTVDDGNGGTDTATVTVTVTQGPPGTGTGNGAGDADGDGIPDALDPTPYGPGSTPGGTGGTGTGTGTGTGSGTGTGGTGTGGTGGSLARTGSDVGLLGATGGVLVLLGSLVLVAVRPTRRRLTTA